MRSLFLTVALITLAVGAYFGARHWQESRELTALNAGIPCDIGAETCVHALPHGGEVAISVTPQPVPLMQTVRVQVALAGSDAQASHLDITGLNMDMGLNRVSLRPTGSGNWEGETIIPVCSQRIMHWRAALMLRDGTRRYLLEDHFFTHRP